MKIRKLIGSGADFAGRWRLQVMILPTTHKYKAEVLDIEKNQSSSSRSSFSSVEEAQAWAEKSVRKLALDSDTPIEWKELEQG